jgi:hypothetical protein
MVKFAQSVLLASFLASTGIALAEQNDCSGDTHAYKCTVNLDKARKVKIEATGAMRSQGAERPSGQLAISIDGAPCKGGDTGKLDWATGVKADFIASCNEPLDAGKTHTIVATPASENAEVTALMLKVE